MPNILDINHYGLWTPFGGYGIASLNSAKYLKRVEVGIYPHPKNTPKPKTPEWDALSDEEREIFSVPWEKQTIGFINSTPFSFPEVDNDIKIGYTMCESDEIGTPWVGACCNMDYVFVPNEFNREVFTRAGVPEDKIRVVKQGIDTERFSYYERPIRDMYTFGMVGYMNGVEGAGDRKGVFDVIRAFVSEFLPWEPVRLYIKSSNKDFGFYSHYTDPRISVDIRHLNTEEMVNLYHIFDCFVFPSRAEGVGMPPREAMSTGLPVILTNYSGLSDICNPRFNFPIEPDHFERGVNPMTVEQPGNWAMIDIQELMYYMRWCFEHLEDAADMGREASEWIDEKESWEVATKSMVKNLKEVKNGQT
jgi:glycosyltransferase involved in cell wall biosynthesis